jgi:hypothetical protein
MSLGRARAASNALSSTLDFVGNQSDSGVFVLQDRPSVSTSPNGVDLPMRISCGDPFFYWLGVHQETRRRTRISATFDSKVFSPFDAAPRGHALVVLLRLRPLPARDSTCFFMSLSTRSDSLYSVTSSSLGPATNITTLPLTTAVSRNRRHDAAVELMITGVPVERAAIVSYPLATTPYPYGTCDPSHLGLNLIICIVGVHLHDDGPYSDHALRNTKTGSTKTESEMGYVSPSAHHMCVNGNMWLA